MKGLTNIEFVRFVIMLSKVIISDASLRQRFDNKVFLFCLRYFYFVLNALSSFAYYNCSKTATANILQAVEPIKPVSSTSVVDGPVGRALSFSHEGPQFKSRCGHLFISLLICDLIDC
jgi:hypothetical protein